jgi:hypothetical protein
MTAQVITSVAPSHPIEGQQDRSIRSWNDAGFEVISVNEPNEVAEVQTVIRKPARDTSKLYGKPYPLLDDIIAACTAEVAIITNSDIELIGNVTEAIAKAEEAVYIGNRLDYDTDPSKGVTYQHGFDLFIVHRKHFQHIHPSLFTLGQTWWDYYLPWCMVKAGVPLRRVAERTIAHRRHAVQYSRQDWERMTEHFKFIANDKQFKHMNASNMTHRIFSLITRNAR